MASTQCIFITIFIISSINIWELMSLCLYEAGYKNILFCLIHPYSHKGGEHFTYVSIFCLHNHSLFQKGLTTGQLQMRKLEKSYPWIASGHRWVKSQRLHQTWPVWFPACASTRAWKHKGGASQSNGRFRKWGMPMDQAQAEMWRGNTK